MSFTLNDYLSLQVKNSSTKAELCNFRAGDTVNVELFITDSKTGNKRIQSFEGLCIARKNKGWNSTFRIRKVSQGYGVEKVFHLYSPMINKMTVVRRGVVRRAKLYYIRKLSGKAARIKEDLSSNKKKQRKV